MTACGVERQGQDTGFRTATVTQNRRHPGREEGLREVQAGVPGEILFCEMKHGIFGRRPAAIDGRELSGEEFRIAFEADFEDVRAGRAVRLGVGHGKVTAVWTKLLQGGLQNAAQFGIAAEKVHRAAPAGETVERFRDPDEAAQVHIGIGRAFIAETVVDEGPVAQADVALEGDVDEFWQAQANAHGGHGVVDGGRFVAQVRGPSGPADKRLGGEEVFQDKILFHTPAQLVRP